MVVEDADQAGQEFGGQPYPARRTPRGNVGYTAFSKKQMTHRVHNQGATPFHNIVTSILYRTHTLRTEFYPKQQN